MSKVESHVVVERLKEWTEAIIANDADAFDNFITDDWVIVTPEVGIVTREDFYEAVSSGRLTHDSMTHEVLRIDDQGEVVILTTRGRNTGTFLGSRIEADEWTTEIWSRRGETWKCSYTQLTPVTGPWTPPEES